MVEDGDILLVGLRWAMLFSCTMHSRWSGAANARRTERRASDQAAGTLRVNGGRQGAADGDSSREHSATEALRHQDLSDSWALLGSKKRRTQPRLESVGPGDPGRNVECHCLLGAVRQATSPCRESAAKM